MNVVKENRKATLKTIISNLYHQAFPPETIANELINYSLVDICKGFLDFMDLNDETWKNAINEIRKAGGRK